MAVVFISSVVNDTRIVQSLSSFLHDAGAAEMYPAGDQPVSYDDWDKQLLASAPSCRAVILVVTTNWLSSDQCYSQFRAAWYMGKRIIPMFFLLGRPEPETIEARRYRELLSEIQGLDLAACVTPDGDLVLSSDCPATEQLIQAISSAGALKDVGLDPRAFDIDQRAKPVPFPGLTSFGDTEADAAVFFGRSREIGFALEELRRMRAEADYRPLVILGASGSGKSSLLKAGVLPRLRRERPSWLAMRVFRPGADPLFSFAQALSRTLEAYQASAAPGHIYSRLSEAWRAASRRPPEAAEKAEKVLLEQPAKTRLAEALLEEFAILRQTANLPDACILVSVDQAEELVRAKEVANPLIGFLSACLDHQPLNTRLALTIRTDSFPELQSSPWFEGFECRDFDLRMMWRHNYDEVIAAPAERYGVSVDADLIDALIQAAPDNDALPLVAFAMQRLWDRSAVSGSITKADYEQFKGLHGLLEDAAERALRGIDNPDDPVPLAEPPAQLTRLATRTFVPALVDVNEAGRVVRRIARWDAFDESQRDLLSRFEKWRLLIANRDEAAGHTIEVAHEALFREWSRFREWLEPERANLESLRQLGSAALTWHRKGSDREYLTHRAPTRLFQAEGLVSDERYRQRLGAVDLNYLRACRQAYDQDRRQRRRARSAIGVMGLLIALGTLAYFNQQFLVRQAFWAIAIRGYVLDPVAEASLASGDKFSECKSTRFCPEMVVLPAGQFVMGQKDGEEDERDTKLVTIATPLAVSRLEISFRQWDTCYQMGGCNLGAKVADGGMRRGNYPVINVSYGHAQAYVTWLSEMTGKNYRLLSEAEWEYAARGGTTTRYSFGNRDEDICTYGNVADRTMRERRPSFPSIDCDDGYYVTAPVGSYAPNPFGLQDMHGNVGEWTNDCYEKSYVGTPTDGSPATTGECGKRVVRGGGWNSRPGFHRSANRTADPLSYKATSVGIRVARSLSTSNQ